MIRIILRVYPHNGNPGSIIPLPLEHDKSIEAFQYLSRVVNGRQALPAQPQVDVDFAPSPEEYQAALDHWKNIGLYHKENQS